MKDERITAISPWNIYADRVGEIVRYQNGQRAGVVVNPTELTKIQLVQAIKNSRTPCVVRDDYGHLALEFDGDEHRETIEPATLTKQDLCRAIRYCDYVVRREGGLTYEVFALHEMGRAAA
jgi:hypothetical protein